MIAKHKNKIEFRRVVSSFILLTFLTGQIFSPAIVQAQLLPNLPAPGQMVWLTSGFQPPVLRGMTVHPENPLLFDFIVDRGQDQINNDLLKEESTKLIKYFLASMTIPDKDAWVNLSPYEKDRIIPDALGQTEMGRQMLEQDYILKQLSASLTNPDKELGQKFWNEVKARAQKQFGTTEIPLNTFNKVWIVPDGATVVEKDGFAYITESKLKVMLDEDYVALENNPNTQPQNQNNQVSKLSSDVFREMILPKLVEEVNNGKNFAQTRQVYQSVILAAWYKKALKDSLLGRIYADKNKVEGVESDVKDIKQKVYDQYLEAFKKGAYNFIKEEDNGEELIPRKYFSGGITYFGETSVNVDRAASSVERALKSVTSSAVDGTVALVAASTIETKAGADLLSVSAASTAQAIQAEQQRQQQERQQQQSLAQQSRAQPQQQQLQQAQHNGGASNVESNGSAEKLGREKLVAHLKALQRRGDGANFQRTLKLIVATINDNPNMLMLGQQELITDDKVREAMGRLDEFSSDNAQRIIQAAGRERDYGPVNQALKELGQSAKQTTEPVAPNETKLTDYLTTLQSQGGAQSVPFQRTLKLIVATVHNNPNMLVQQDLITDDKVREAMGRLDEFSSDNAQRIIQAAGRERDYGPVNQALKEFLESAKATSTKEQQPSKPAPQNVRIPQAAARKKISDLRKLKAQINDGQLPEVLNFGDKHGKIEDLKRILEHARQAAQEGRPLKIIGHGDGFDRGADNIKVLEIFKELKRLEAENSNISVKFLWGNHDVWLVQAILLDDMQAAAQWKAQGGQEVIDQFNKAGLDIKELALFMVQNFELFHVDAWGFMHVHAGIPMDDKGNPRIAREQINQLEEQWKGMQAEIRAGPLFFADARNQQRAAQFFKQASPLFWVRGNAWHAKAVESRLDDQIQIDNDNKGKLFAILKQVINAQLQQQGVTLSQDKIGQEIEQNWVNMLLQNEEIFKKAGVVFQVLDRNPKVNKDVLDNFLGQLEVNGIVVGHDHHNRLLNIDNRIFGIDVDDADVGHLKMNGNGIEFNALARSLSDIVLGKAAMLVHIDEQLKRLGEQAGEVAEETKPEEVTKPIVQTPTKKPVLPEGQREIAFSKTRMHDLNQGFQVGWGEGLFEFKVRESTSQAGASRVWDIKIKNKNIPVVAGRDASGKLVLGDSLLIEEGQQLDIGRDRVGNNYVFSVGGRTYAVAQYQNQFVLIRRSAISAENFNLSRSVRNGRDQVTVSTEGGATSRTTIQPFIMATNPQEALEILSKVFNRGNYLSEASSSPLAEDQNRFGANNNSKIPQATLEAMNAHPAADVQKEFEGRLEALRLQGQRVRENAQIRAADWARAALRNPLALPMAYREFMRFDVERGRDIRVVQQFQDQAAGRFDPARGIIALRDDADQYVEFHEAAEMVARIFKFRKDLERQGVDANNPQSLMDHARLKEIVFENAQDALEKLMDKFFAENPDLVNQLHERAARLESRLKIKARVTIAQRSQELESAVRMPSESEGAQKSLADSVRESNSKETALISELSEILITLTDFSRRFSLIEAINNLFIGMPQDIPGQIALPPDEVDEPVVLASLRLFQDTEGNYRFMDPRARRVDPSLQSLIEKFGIEARTVSDEEWNAGGILSIPVRGGKIYRIALERDGHFGTDNGDAVARAGINLILLPQTMSKTSQRFRDEVVAHEIGHNLDFRMGLREILSYESDDVLKAVMKLGESRLRYGQASLRDSSGNLRVDDFRKILKTEDFAGKEIIAEAFMNAWRSPNWDDPGTQFFRDWVPEAFEGRDAAKTNERAKSNQEIDAPTRLGANIGTAALSGIDSSTPATAPVVANPGGIDFDPSKLNLQIKRDGHGVPLPLPMQNLENIDIKGLYPVIINIMPINAQTLPILSQLNVQPKVALSKS